MNRILKTLRNYILYPTVSTSLAVLGCVKYLEHTDPYGFYPFVEYHTQPGESLEDLFRGEGRDPKNAKDFLKFQRAIYEETKFHTRPGLDDYLEWKDNELQIKDYVPIFVPDINKDGKVGKQKKEKLEKKEVNYGFV